MTSFRREAELLEPVAKYVRRRGFRWQETELSFYEYRIDLYGFSRLESLSVAIELKLRNWRRALQQALIYQLCADRVFAALPRVVVTQQVLDAFAEYGLGIIGVEDSGRCSQLLLPEQSFEVQSRYRRHFVSLVYGTAVK